MGCTIRISTPAAQALRPDHAALSLRRPAHRSLVCHDALGCPRALSCACAATMCSSRWASMPLACRPRTRPSSAASTPRSGPTPTSSACASSSRRMGAMFDWRREAVSADPEYYRWTRVVLHPALQARAGLPQDVAGGLVPELQHHPGARAGVGRRPPLRALRHAGDQEEPGAVVLPHHPVRRGAAGFLAHRLAGARAARCRPTGSGARRALR